jgi:hypothetical protein
MLKRLGLGAALLVALPGGARAQEAPEMETSGRRAALDAEAAADDQSAPAGPGWLPRITGKVRGGAGAINGVTIVPGRAALSLIEGQLTAGLDRGLLSLEVPLAVGHRQTFAGASLSETSVDGAGRATVRLPHALRLTAELGLSDVSRPGWPDPFQMVAGVMAPTDRYSHWDRRAVVELAARPDRRQTLRARYDYELSVYRRDPAFDATYDPLHLSPWDEDTHRLDLLWQRAGNRWKLELGAELASRRHFFRFSGDAVTGTTHAGPGGEPPNPLLHLRWANPRLAGQVDRGPVTLRAGYELELVQDTYQGYLSYVGHHPELSVTWSLPRGALTAGAELFLRRYGASSYAGGTDATHPPLSWGDRRTDRLGTATLALRVPAVFRWSALASASLAVRRTNYATTINWNYSTWQVWAGAEYTY